MTDLLAQAYDPGRFRQQGHQLIDLLADYFEKMLHPSVDEKVLNYETPENLFQRWKEDLENAPHQKRRCFFLKQCCTTSSTCTTQNTWATKLPLPPPWGLWQSWQVQCLTPEWECMSRGTSGVVIERVLSKKIGALIGWDVRCDGFLTSGGTLGNLTALLCARQVMAEGDVWENGLQGETVRIHGFGAGALLCGTGSEGDGHGRGRASFKYLLTSITGCEPTNWKCIFKKQKKKVSK